ncbi:MAG: hypothetical protein K5654_05570 [Lachnospiraceae bacterium]|nr:hypothetical protein [Lachnospiraceae bacterium]
MPNELSEIKLEYEIVEGFIDTLKDEGDVFSGNLTLDETDETSTIQANTNIDSTVSEINSIRMSISESLFLDKKKWEDFKENFSKTDSQVIQDDETNV